MSIRVSPFRKGGWEVDIRVETPSGDRIRERLVAPVSSRTAAQRWAEQRAAHLAFRGRIEPAGPEKLVPTFAEFAPRFLKEYATAERQKASGVASKESIIRVHLIPRIGTKRLDALTDEDVQQVKSELIVLKPKTVNNVLSVLSKLLKVAEEWSVIDEVPCRVRLLKQHPPEMGFFSFSEYAELVKAAERIDRRTLSVVLLAGDAGLRAGEITALEWSDINFTQGLVTIQRSEWSGHVDAPKSGRSRKVPMTSMLMGTLRELRHLKGPRLLYADKGGHATKKVLRNWMTAAQRRAGLEATGNIHILRHTFCSHLAMQGAPAKAIQELAGHANLSTTMRYMHLSPGARTDAIRLLNRRPVERGDQGETAPCHQETSSDIK